MGFRHWLCHNSKWEKSLSPLENWMVLFVCLWILVPLKNFSLIWRHLFLPRAANFNLCSALMAIEQWRFFSMPHLTWHGASMYNGPVTFTPIAEPLAVELFLLWPFIWRNLNPLHPRMHCAKFGWNWPSGYGEDENVKSLQTDWRTDDGKKVIRKAHLSFQLRWAKNVKRSQQRLRRQQRWQSADKLWSGKLSWAFGSGELKIMKGPVMQ